MSARRLLLGKVVRLGTVGMDNFSCACVRVRFNEFDKFLKMYFAAHKDEWAWNKDKSVGLGDTVLIREMADPLSTKVPFVIERTVYKFGNVIDPVTGRKVVTPEKDANVAEWEQALIKKEMQEVSS